MSNPNHGANYPTWNEKVHLYKVYILPTRRIHTDVVLSLTFPRHFPVPSPNRHQTATRIEFGANECVSVGRGEFTFFFFFSFILSPIV
jgi:hypothetical protein